jgi:hypothetical protein
MAKPVDAYVTLPDDSSNTGKKVRTQTRTVSGQTVHEHFFVVTSPRRITGIYSAVSTLYTVANSAQNGTSAAIGWLQVPSTSTTNCRLRYIMVSHTNNVATAIDHATAPRIAVQRTTFTGDFSGASLSTVKRATADSSNQCDVRTASTGATINLVTTALVWASLVPGIDITTSGVYNSQFSETWRPNFEDEFVELIPGEALAIYQIDAGTASDQRKCVVSVTWDEVDNQS